MAGPILEKTFLWRESGKGFKARFSSELEDPPLDRDDLPDLVVNQKVERGNIMQRARLKRYPSIDVDLDRLYAGEVEADLEEAVDMLNRMGFRNNPTAYVEVTEEHGPDDGSYSRTFVSETGTRFDMPKLVEFPSVYKRIKRQIHITVYKVKDKVIFLAHEEKSAWLQPARHVFVNDASARVGVRDFRDLWYDEFNRELPGKDRVKWETTN